MSPEQIKLVQTSWSKLIGNSKNAGDTFYQCLFEQYPKLKNLFISNPNQQTNKFTSTITLAVNSLQHFDTIAPAIKELGIRHISYGVEEEHYEFVGCAFVQALDKLLGEEFDEETKNAWLAVYDKITSEMIQAAKKYLAA